MAELQINTELDIPTYMLDVTDQVVIKIMSEQQNTNIIKKEKIHQMFKLRRLLYYVQIIITLQLNF